MQNEDKNPTKANEEPDRNQKPMWSTTGEMNIIEDRGPASQWGRNLGDGCWALDFVVVVVSIWFYLVSAD